jgi:hypothetical protein
MQKKTPKKLKLNAETVRQIGEQDLLAAAGGITNQPSRCPAEHSCFYNNTVCS